MITTGTKPALIVVELDDFGTDGNGNTIARHTVKTYSVDGPAIQPRLVYATKRRLQTGAHTNRDESMGTVLARAGFKLAELSLSSVVGSRTDDVMFFNYRYKAPKNV